MGKCVSGSGLRKRIPDTCLVGTSSGTGHLLWSLNFCFFPVGRKAPIDSSACSPPMAPTACKEDGWET